MPPTRHQPNGSAALDPSDVAAQPPPTRGPLGARFSLRRLFAFLGPGYLIAIGYMDPGNWATDLAGGSGFGYALLWIVMLSSAMAMLLQVLAARLGIVTGLDLAQACRQHSRPGTVVWQWLLCEAAICAADLAEVIGTAIALKLLFGLPLFVGVLLTVLDVFLVLWLQQRGYRHLEALVISLIAVVLSCLVVTVALSQPVWRDVFTGLVPTSRTLVDPSMLYIAIGIIGATVMPHNLYLHSSLVRSRAGLADKRTAIAYATVDILAALSVAFVINALILVMAGSAFHANGHRDVAELEDAHGLLAASAGGAVAGTAFALALLASGQSSAVTATLAGQIVMEGFLRLTIPPWARRLLTRAVAVVPAAAVVLLYGEAAIGKLLVASQVVLSLQLPFAMVPLIRFTSSRALMGDLVNGRLMVLGAATVAALIVSLNGLLIWWAFT